MRSPLKALPVSHRGWSQTASLTRLRLGALGSLAFTRRAWAGVHQPWTLALKFEVSATQPLMSTPGSGSSAPILLSSSSIEVLVVGESDRDAPITTIHRCAASS